MDQACTIDLNLDLIKVILEKLNWTGKIIHSSELGVNLHGLDKIIGILQKLEVTEYITGEGSGSKRYIDEQTFQNLGIKLTYQNFKENEYSQMYDGFISNLSIIDLLFNEGFESKHLIL